MGVEEKLAQELHTLRYSPVPVKGETVCNAGNANTHHLRFAHLFNPG